MKLIKKINTQIIQDLQQQNIQQQLIKNVNYIMIALYRNHNALYETFYTAENTYNSSIVLWCRKLKLIV